MSPPRNVLRRFTALWIVSVLVKLAALGVFLYLVLRFFGGVG